MCFPPLHFCWAIQHKLVWCVWWKTSECSLWFCKDFFDQCLFFFLFSEVQSGMVNRGPVKNRSSTDIICLIIFIAFLVGWGFIGFYGKDTHFKLTYKNVFPPLLLLLFLPFVSPVFWREGVLIDIFLLVCQDSHWAIRNALSILLIATEKSAVSMRQWRISPFYSILI